MKSFIVMLVMSMTAATRATAGDPDGTDQRLRCSQLIIRNPAPFDDIWDCCIYGDPWIVANHMSNCCLDGTYLRDCLIIEHDCLIIEDNHIAKQELIHDQRS
jgi:hypothetical protein